MPYGKYSGPDKADKGMENGSCNRSSCQDSPAIWYNHGSLAWYCAECRANIQFDRFNYNNWNKNHRVTCGHPMFETRKMMDERMGIINDK